METSWFQTTEKRLRNRQFSDETSKSSDEPVTAGMHLSLVDPVQISNRG